MRKLIPILMAFVLLTSFTDNEPKQHLNQDVSWITLPHPLPSESLDVFKGISYLYQPNYCAFFGHNSYDFYGGDSSYNHEEYTSRYDSVTILINNKYFIVTPNEKGKLTITELSED